MSEMNFDPITGRPQEQTPTGGESQNQASAMPESSGQEQPPTGGDTQNQTFAMPESSGQEQPPAGGDTMYFNPETGKMEGQAGSGMIPEEPGRKKSKWKIAVIAIAAVCAMAGIVAFAGIKSGVFLSKSDKVLLAIANTAADGGRLLEDMDTSSIVTSGDCTFSMEMEAEGVSLEGDVRITDSQKQITGNAKISGVPNVEFKALLTNEDVKVQIPTIYNGIFAYNYVEEKSGYLTEQADAKDIEVIDKLFKSLNSESKQQEMALKMSESILKEYRSMEIKEVSKKEFEVDGEKRDCKGYAMTFTSKNAVHLMETMEEVMKEGYGDLLSMSDTSIEEEFEEAYEECRNMKDIEVTFYIYKNKLASILAESEGDEIQLQFLGGDTRTQNMKLLAGEETVLEVEGSKDGDLEKTELKAQGETVGEWEYDSKSGDLKAQFGGSEGMTLEANIENDKKELTIDLKKIQYPNSYSYEDMELSGKISITGDVSIEKMEGEEFDIGNASEEEYWDLMQEIQGGYSGI